VVRVQFLLQDSEVQRVERESMRYRREREARKLGLADDAAPHDLEE